MVTCAVGTTAPEGSTTWPVMLPVSCCAKRNGPTTINPNQMAQPRSPLCRINVLPPSLYWGTQSRARERVQHIQRTEIRPPLQSFLIVPISHLDNLVMTRHKHRRTNMRSHLTSRISRNTHPYRIHEQVWYPY